MQFHKLRYETLKFAFPRAHFKMYRLFTKNQKVWLCGRGDLTSLFFSKVAKLTEVRGNFSSNVGNEKSFTSRPSDCKNYALVQVLCTIKNSKSIYKYIKSIFYIPN